MKDKIKLLQRVNSYLMAKVCKKDSLIQELDDYIKVLTDSRNDLNDEVRDLNKMNKKLANEHVRLQRAVAKARKDLEDFANMF